MGRRPAVVARLARERPAHAVVFVLLHDGEDSMPMLYHRRRARLEDPSDRLALRLLWTLCPSTTSRTLVEAVESRLGAVGYRG